ncbi:DNA primase [Eubacteriaceae bacterium ES3]|nr:DNA primase [Eubacteriaceae bacterium ES3]
MANYYSDEVIQSVIEANDIVDIISGYLTLKRTGNSYKGKCPFHNEKTPSFSVSQEKQLYHCFGCGAGGNAITFIMEMEKLPFMDALKLLADRGNVRLPEKTEADSDSFEQKKRLYELHRLTGNYFYKHLKSDHTALAYLFNRGISASTVKQFGLGYSRDEWNDLGSYLKEQGFTENEMIDSGLVMRSESGRTYDRFRGRIMFPIINPRGQIVGFGGRIISKAAQGPKYLNSPETLIFSKSYELYNLNDAKRHLANGRIYLVEGYMDVVSLYEKGIKNAVAALGTAFTAYHGKILERYVKEVILLFDGDSAGQSATEKAMNVLKKSDINVKIIVLADDEDPDSFIQKNGLEAFEALTKNAMTVIEYELMLLKKQFDLSHTDGKISYGTAAIKVLKECSTAVEIDFYSQRIAQETGINKNVIRSEIIRARSGRESANIIETEVKGVSDNDIPKAYYLAQDLVVRYVLENREAINEFSTEILTLSEYREFIRVLKENPETKVSGILSHFPESSKIKRLSGLLMAEESVLRTDFEDALKICRRFYNESQLEKITGEIQIATQNGQEERVAELMEELIKLKKENGRR